VAAIIVTVMLIPQSLAYALLAGLPAYVGLYASILPLMVYAVFGTSRTLSVGPVAVASLMTAAALAPLAEVGSPEYLAGAVLLAGIDATEELAVWCREQDVHAVLVNGSDPLMRISSVADVTPSKTTPIPGSYTTRTRFFIEPSRPCRGSVTSIWKSTA